MPSVPGWPVVVLVAVLAIVFAIKWGPDLLRQSKSRTPAVRREQKRVFSDPAPRRGRSGAQVDDVTVRLPAPELPVDPARPPYATSVFAAITPSTPRPSAGSGQDEPGAPADEADGSVDTETVSYLAPTGEQFPAQRPGR